jgi:Uma2 family endonuclease
MDRLARHIHYTQAEYLALEEQSPTKHEFFEGEIYAMAGGSPDHAALASALVRCLATQLPKTCRFFSSDLRVHCAATGLFTYPDASVICGATVRAASDRLSVENPRALFEITSTSTEDYDRGAKLRHYMQIASVQEVAIVSHREQRVTVHRRLANEWTLTEFYADDSAALESIGVVLQLADLYRDGLEDA